MLGPFPSQHLFQLRFIVTSPSTHRILKGDGNLGFSDHAYLARTVREQLGQTPAPPPAAGG
jgi:hypothetical protein